MPPDHPVNVNANAVRRAPATRGGRAQFSTLRASSLYCSKCQAAKPVRERLLLVLPGKEIYDYLCTVCANSVGQREVTAAEKQAGAALIV